MYIDAHCHLDLASLRRRPVGRTRARTCRGCQPIPCRWRWPGWLKTTCSHSWKGVLAAGLHPVHCAELSRAERRQALQDLPTCFEGPAAAIAVGETGLDRVFAHADTLATQIESLRTHLELAKALEIPIILHVVGAHGACIDILRKDVECPNVEAWCTVSAVLPRSLRSIFDRDPFERVRGGGASALGTGLERGQAIPDERLFSRRMRDQAMEKGSSEPVDLILVAERVAKFGGALPKKF